MIQYADRKYFMITIIVLVSIIMIIRLFYLQIIDPSYRDSALNNSLRIVTQYPARGLIMDRHGELLVSNQAAYDLMVTPMMLDEFDTMLLCELVRITPEFLALQLKAAENYSRFRPSIVVRQVSVLDYAKLQEHMYKFPGFFVQPRTLRNYPGNIAAHVLGYIGEVNRRIIEQNPYYVMRDYIGMSGVEHAYEIFLRGEKGYKYYLVDVHNRIKGSYQDGRRDRPAKTGKDLTLTIDAELQRYGEELMQNKRGSIIAIEPKTGEILAFVSAPSYNPNLLVGRERGINFSILSTDTLKPLFNRPIMANYPPGSTFKIFNALAGLQSGAIKPDTRYWCNQGFRSGHVYVKCRSHPNPVNVTTSIKVSCNSFYCKTFEDIMGSGRFIEDAYNRWREKILSFGLGDRLGVDLPNEFSGSIPESDLYNRIYGKNHWSYLTILSLAIGQGELLLTPLQMANSLAAIANRGFYVPPHVIKEIEGEKIPDRFQEKIYTEIDSVHFEPVIEGMYQVVNAVPGTGGTATFSRLPGFDICGKTGTAENPHGKDHSIFIAFAPKDDPQIAMAVYVEQGGFGSVWAAPIASLMIEKYLTDTISRSWYEQRILDAVLLE